MKPKIINTSENYHAITEAAEDVLTSDPGVAEQVEQGFNLVKTPDDEYIAD